MAMTVMNNGATMSALGQLKKNDTTLSKQLKKVASGMKINGAGDGASEYAISERMRVRLRALNQDDQNVQNGAKLLRVAEGGIQNQIDIMRTIKQKVIDANNDTNTEVDRATIQKEINQGYDQINDIASLTSYNGNLVLLGDEVRRVERKWVKLDGAEWQPGSDFGIIPDESWEYTELGKVNHRYHPVLDNVNGPFDIFHEYEEKDSAIPSLNLASSNPFTPGTNGTASEYKMSLSGYGQTNGQDNVSSLNNVAFRINSEWYVLTTDTTQTFHPKDADAKGLDDSGTMIDISGLTTYAQIANAITTTINGSSSRVTAKVSGSDVLFTTKAECADSAYINFDGLDLEAYQDVEVIKGHDKIPATAGYTIPAIPGYDLPATGQISGQKNFSGGRDASGVLSADVPPAWDVDFLKKNKYKPGAKAFVNLTVSKAPDGSSVTLHDQYGTSIGRLKFIGGTNGLTEERPGLYTIGKAADVSGASFFAGMTLDLHNGELKLTAPYEGDSYNDYYLTDGVHVAEIPAVVFPPTPEQPAVPDVVKVTDYDAAKAFDSVPADPYDNGFMITKHGTDGDHAKITISYPPAGTDVEDLIRDLRGKSITYFHGQFEFIDSKGGLYAEPRASTGTAIDVDKMRQAVAAGKTVNEAFAQLMMELDPSTYTKRGDWDKDKQKYKEETLNTVTADANGVTITYPYQGLASGETLDVKRASLRMYDIDFGKWADNVGFDLDKLDGTGFRVYCATDSHEWWNFRFVNGEIEGERPKSGTDEEEIKSIVINVEGVQNATQLAKAFYDQAEPYLEGQVEGAENYDHYMRLRVVNDGVVTIFDRRRWDVNNENYDYQQEGAKIADGVIDNVGIQKRNVLCKELIIQHTDKANMNIKLFIPRTTMDQIFAFIPGEESAYDYKVTDQEMRLKMLGNPPKEPGILDKAIDYLTDANTLVGAQIKRMEVANENIVTQKESTQASESTIRDSDMAREMTNFTKANVLAQASQSMLAQANQNASSVLSLLQ